MEGDRQRNTVTDDLVVQNDWHLSLKDACSQFYIGLRRPGVGKSEYFDVQTTKLIDEWSFTVLPGKSGENTVRDTDFTVTMDEHKHLHVTYAGKTTVFVSPTKEQTVVGFESAPHCIDFSPSGSTYIVADASGHLMVRNARHNQTMVTLRGQTMDIYRCRIYPSGEVALAGGMDMAIRIWAIDTGRCAKTLQGHVAAVTGLGIFGVGKTIVSCSNDGSARIWSCGSGENTETFVLEAGKCIDLAAARKGYRFAVICELNQLSVIVLDAHRTKHNIQLPSAPTTVCFSDDETGEVAFVGFEDGHVAAYQMSSQQMIGEIRTEKGSVTSVAHKGTRLFVSFNGGCVTVYQVPTLASLAAGDATTIRAEFELTGPDCDPVYDISVQKNTVVTCCRDHKIRLYDL